jgi:hypothetical protein
MAFFTRINSLDSDLERLRALIAEFGVMSKINPTGPV